MKLSLPFLLFSLPGLVLCAKKPSQQAPKVAKFSALAKKHGGVVPLDTALYDEITSTPRNYSVSVVLTAMATQFQCGPCRSFDPEHRMVAKQWAKSPERDSHFLAVLDFNDGKEIYRRLNLNSAPTFQLFLPTEGPRASPSLEPEVYDFSRSSFKAESLSNYLRTSAKIPLDFTRPPDYAKMATVGALTVGSVLLGVLAWQQLKLVLFNRYIWAFGSIWMILLMISGYMWNQIRKPPYMVPTREGGISYVAGGYSNQFGAETHIVSAMYGVLAFAVYTIAVSIPKLEDPIRQRIAVYVWTLVLVVMFGVLMQLFRLKNPGYPFKIIF